MGEWIIIQPVIKEGIKKACKEFLKSKKIPSNPSVPNILSALNLYWESNIEALPPELKSEYKSAEDPFTLDLLKCALKKTPGNESHKKRTGKPVGVNIKVAGKTPLLLDLLCYFSSENVSNWTETLKKFGLSAETYFRGEEKETSDNKVEKIAPQSTQPQVQHVITSTQVTDFSKSQIQIIDGTFWKAYELADNKKAILSRYYTHADSSLVKEVIANNEAVPPNDFVLVSDSDGNVEERTITETIKSPDRYGIFLLKVILEGGVGKTTFLHWIAKQYQDSYNFILITYLGSLDIRKIITQAKSLKKQNGLPVSLLLDNVSDGSVSKQFERLIREVKAEPELSDTLFIIAERESRYRNEFIDSRAEMLFGGNVLSIVNVEVNREILFDKIYDYLLVDNPTLAEEAIRKQARDEFLNNNIQSISESIHYLIKSLKLKNVINYTFDWEDWSVNKFEKQELQFLYAVVACFYQFGIKVSTSISTKILGFALEIDIVNAINRFGGNKCPIQLTEDTRFLSLKHEHLANWFLDYPENKKLVMAFFRTFLTEIDNKTNAKLLRKIRKVFRRDEFRSSILAEEFNLPVYIEITKAYIELPTTNTDEKIKMLMEQGIAYNLLGNEKEAIHSFERVLNIEGDNNHAKDQLARIYLNSPDTYSLAFSKYYEVYKNDGLYALKHLYFILRKCKSDNVKLNLAEGFTFSSSEIFEIANLLVENRNLDEAIELLKTIPEEEHNFEVARLYNLIAHYLPFSDETVGKKLNYFRTAIYINDKLENSKEYFQFDVDYTVCLYRIRDFFKSTKSKKIMLNKFPRSITHKIEEAYLSKVRSITKLFFVNMPQRKNETALKDFLYTQSKEGAAMINRERDDVESIIQGILIFHSVRLHSRNSFPLIFKNATRHLGYAYTYHADKPINNLTPYEIRGLAENYYDMLLKMEGVLEYTDYFDMIRNLQNFELPEKSVKIIRLIKYLFQNSFFKKVPGFYRLRGNAHAFLGDYSKALFDYKKAEELIPTFKFKKAKYIATEQVSLYNRLASTICDMHEQNVLYDEYDLNLETANSYISKSLSLKPDVDVTHIISERIKRLLD